MLTLNDLLTVMESVQFAAEVNVASSHRAFRNIIRNHAAVQDLLDYIDNHPEASEVVYRRMLELLKMETNPDYEHPHDATIAAYFYVLDHCCSGYVIEAVRLIGRTPKLFWAKRVASDYTLETPEPNGEHRTSPSVLKAILQYLLHFGD